MGRSLRRTFFRPEVCPWPVEMTVTFNLTLKLLVSVLLGHNNSRKETESYRLVFLASTKREIRHFHAVVEQRRLRKVKKTWCTCKVVVSTNSEFTQQDGREKKTAESSCVTNVTRLFLTCFVVIFTYHQCFLVFYKKICLKEGEFWRKVISSKIIVTLVTQGLPSSFLSRPVA